MCRSSEPTDSNSHRRRRKVLTKVRRPSRRNRGSELTIKNYPMSPSLRNTEMHEEIIESAFAMNNRDMQVQLPISLSDYNDQITLARTCKCAHGKVEDRPTHRVPKWKTTCTCTCCLHGRLHATDTTIAISPKKEINRQLRQLLNNHL